MLNVLKKFFDSNEKEIAKVQKTVDAINALEPKMLEMSFVDMQARVREVRAELAELNAQLPAEARNSLKRVEKKKGLPAYEVAIQQKLWAFMPEFYAMIREVMRRDFDRRHFDVQLIAGAILAQGHKLVELKTGEGKTQTFHLPLFLYSLVGRGSHMVTVNDYLARRDGEYAGQVASRLGLTVGVVAPGGACYRFVSTEELKAFKGEDIYNEVVAMGQPTISGMKGLNLIECTKREAYMCDITYGVNNEFGFDYLRDNMAMEHAQLSQRELYFCVVDEADSILIDEARTPLIISAVPSESDTDKYRVFANAVKSLVEDTDYTLDHKTRSAMLTETGIETVEKILGVENLWSDYSMVHHLENALKAKALFIKDDHYIVKNGEVLIVDSFTGRVLPGRRYSEGLHQAIEAKESVEIQKESKTYASITFQNYFRLYKVLCGGSGTILTEAEEFYSIYDLESIVIPTNKPLVRIDSSDVIYRSQDAKFKNVVKEIKERNEKGQPVLVGTTSVEKSELVSRLLDEQGIPHSVLNAKYHEREAQIVAKAGEKGAVTVATNMAGRGTDIPLGEGVVELGGLAVIGTERHDARRIDNQLRGRSGRQGDPGYTRFYVALDDQIMRILGGDLFSRSVGKMMDDDQPIEFGLISKQIESAQKRVEWMHFDARKHEVEYDDVMNSHRVIFYTRRRNILDLTEAALGKLDESLSAEERTQRQSDARADLEVLVAEIIKGELRVIVNSQFGGEKKLSEDQLDKLVKHFTDLAPDVLLAKAFDVSPSALEAKLKDQLRGREQEATFEFLGQGIDQLLHSRAEEFGLDFPMLVKVLMLEVTDKQWVEHLETMADIRSGIRLQSYAQRDPLVEYKNIAYKEFEELMGRIDSGFARIYFKAVRVNQPQVAAQSLTTNEKQVSDIITGDREMNIPAKNDLSKVVDRAMREAKSIQTQVAQVGANSRTVKKGEKIGRNDPCPCGSGKKYKKCHYPQYG